MLSIDAAAQLLVREWVKLYKVHPRLTVVLTFVLSAVGGTIVYFADKHAQERQEALRLQNFSYAAQVEALDETRASLSKLVEFVDSQKNQLQVSQQTLENMRSEHDRLKPLIESDKKVIDALFAAQEARNAESQNRERRIGFALGVVSSIVASLIWAAFTYAISRSNKADSIAAP